MNTQVSSTMLPASTGHWSEASSGRTRRVASRCGGFVGGVQVAGDAVVELEDADDRGDLKGVAAGHHVEADDDTGGHAIAELRPVGPPQRTDRTETSDQVTNAVTLENACGVDEPAMRLPAAGVDIGLTVGHTPEFKGPASPHRLQGLAEFVQHGVIPQESCHGDDFASRPDASVVRPTIGTDKAGTRDEVGTSPVAISLGRSSKHSHSSLVRTSIAAPHDNAGPTANLGVSRSQMSRFGYGRVAARHDSRRRASCSRHTSRPG